MAVKRLAVAFVLAAGLAVATPKPAEAVAYYCAQCQLAQSWYNSFNQWWDSVNPFPLW